MVGGWGGGDREGLSLAAWGFHQGSDVQTQNLTQQTGLWGRAEAGLRWYQQGDTGQAGVGGGRDQGLIWGRAGAGAGLRLHQQGRHQTEGRGTGPVLGVTAIQPSIGGPRASAELTTPRRCHLVSSPSPG